MTAKFSIKSLSFFVFLVFALLFSSQVLNAKHIVGGDMTYRCMGIDSMNNQVMVAVTLNMYRDCDQEGISNLTPFDGMLQIGVYRGAGNNWSFVREFSIEPSLQEERINPEDDPCVEIPPDLCVDRALYEVPILTLDASLDQNYIFVYQRCCRNNTIDNIVRPDITGAAITLEINPKSFFIERESTNMVDSLVHNDSPRFNKFPPILICNGFSFEFDHSAGDFNGDSISYRFCQPLVSGGDRGTEGNPGDATACDGVFPNPRTCPPAYPGVEYTDGYSTEVPILGDPDFTIDPITGIISGRPRIAGQFVVGVCADEWRNGVKIGEISRDFQFNVSNCRAVEANVDTTNYIDPPDMNIGVNVTQSSGCGFEVMFLNESIGYDDGSITGQIWETVIDGSIQSFTSREPTITFPGPGIYSIKLTVNPQLECKSSDSIEISLFPELVTDFDFFSDVCELEVEFDGQQISPSNVNRWSWDFGEGGTANVEDPIYTFTEPGSHPVRLNIQDEFGCRASITKVVDYFPAPQVVVVEPNRFVGCAPGDVFFNNLSSPIDETYQVTWDFGDGSDPLYKNDISPTHLYTTPGIYDVSVEIVSPLGCTISKRFNDWIRIEQGPVADFSFTPEEVRTLNTDVVFTNLSSDADEYIWDFDDGSISFDENPLHAFRDTGFYNVVLVASELNGCADTASVLIPVFLDPNPIPPNAFTPNGDNKNDIFRLVINENAVSGYQFIIWDRWGERVYETFDAGEGWNGRKDSFGQDMPNGVYVWQVRYVDFEGESEERTGSVLLIR